MRALVTGGASGIGRAIVERLDGDVVVLDLADAGLSFGAGRHACPGQAAAVALATGVVAGVRA